MTSIIIAFDIIMIMIILIIIIIIIINMITMTINDFYQSLYLYASLSKEQILSTDGLLLCIISDIGSTETVFVRIFWKVSK